MDCYITCSQVFSRCFTRFGGGYYPKKNLISSKSCHIALIIAVLGMSLWKVTLLGSNLASVTDFKRIETPHSLCCDFGGYETFTTRWSCGTVQVWVQVWALAVHLAFSPKSVPEGNWRFRVQNQQPSSWGSSPALLARDRRASTNTGRFPVCCSRCWHWQARLREKYYHSCDTDSVRESARF